MPNKPKDYIIDTQGYTQRDWDRVVGWGKVPEEYKRKPTEERSDVESDIK